jgi:hypothetical protein
MSVTSVPLSQDQLSDEEYEALLDDLRAYRAQLEQADYQADAGSLNRAANLTRLYRDKRWTAYMDREHPIKRTIHRGRPVDPEGRSRFAKYIMEETGLSPRRSYQLWNANALVGILRTAFTKIGDGEWALRPLSKLLREHRPEQATDVWRRAIQLAEGDTPTVAHVRKALADHDKALGYRVPRGRTSDGRSFTDVRRRFLADFEWVAHNATDAQRELLMADLKERLAQLKTKE